MSDKEIIQELRLKEIDETKNYSIEKIKQSLHGVFQILLLLC